LPRCPRLLAILACGLLVARATGDEPAPAAASVYRGANAASAEDAGRAERIVAACLAGLARQSSISARMRQIARVGDKELVGAGQYVQQGIGEDQRFRFESSLAANAAAYTMLEVCDGLAFWSYQKHADLPPSLNRVDTRRVRAKLETATPPLAQADAITPHLGGVQRTLALIRESFRFHSVEGEDLDGMAVWRIEGRWHADRLVGLVPELAGKAVDGEVPAGLLPENMPWRVVLSIGKRELFPFRIEWLAVRGPRPAANREPEQIAVLELYDVRLDEPIDATAFVYKPAAEGYSDVTESFLGSVNPLRP